MSDAKADTVGTRLRDLISGAAEAPSDFVGYHVKMAREAQAEQESLVQAINESAQQLGVLRHRAVIVRAQLEAHLEAIAAWDEHAREASQSGQPAL